MSYLTRIIMHDFMDTLQEIRPKDPDKLSDELFDFYLSKTRQGINDCFKCSVRKKLVKINGKYYLPKGFENDFRYMLSEWSREDTIMDRIKCLFGSERWMKK